MATLDSIRNELIGLRVRVKEGDVEEVCSHIDRLVDQLSELDVQDDSEQEKLRTIRQLSISVGYQINTLLTGVFGNVQLLQEKVSFDEEDRQHLDDLLELAKAITEVIRKMQSIRRYITMPYVQGEQAIDLDKSSQEYHTA